MEGPLEGQKAKIGEIDRCMKANKNSKKCEKIKIFLESERISSKLSVDGFVTR